MTLPTREDFQRLEDVLSAVLDRLDRLVELHEQAAHQHPVLVVESSTTQEVPG